MPTRQTGLPDAQLEARPFRGVRAAPAATGIQSDTSSDLRTKCGSSGSTTRRRAASSGVLPGRCVHHDGTRLVYRQGDAFIRATLDARSGLQVSGRELVLRSAAAAAEGGGYGVMPDGRLVVLEPASGGDRIVLVEGWTAELRRQLRMRRGR